MTTTTTDRRRWRTLESVVLCTYHGEVHPREEDYFEVGDPNCAPLNWKNVAVLGTAVEAEGY